MHLSKLNAEQLLSVLKAGVYVGLSAALDFVISQSTGTQFGFLTPLINVVAVLIKKAFTNPESE